MILKKTKNHEKAHGNYIAAIGVETSIKHDQSLERMINESQGVVRWIVPEEYKTKVFSKYTKTLKYGAVIFDRIK